MAGHGVIRGDDAMHRVLLVDDSATDRTLLKGLLSKDPSLEVETLASGREALERLGDGPVSAVVTDMQMPEMDGLELVTAVRARFPHIPVILITGQGSEALAAKALKRGAAGYVPKAHSHQLLGDTVRHVIELSQSEGDHERLLNSSTHAHFDFELENDPTLIAPLQDLAQRMAGSMGIADTTGCLQVGVALEHAVTNAMLHGNLEVPREVLADLRHTNGKRNEFLAERSKHAPYNKRLVRVAVDVTREAIQLVISDDGRGFDVQEVTNVGLTRSLSGGSGQGLFLMWAFMDKVTFDKSGTKVTLVKNREQHPVAPAVVVESPSVPERPAAEQTGNFGELVSLDDGRVIPLNKKRMTVGRLDSCDLVLHHATISQHHCVLCLYQGWWFVKDLHSKNGTRVNHNPVVDHLLRPGNTLTLGSLEFEVRYQPYDLGAIGITPPLPPF
jgi:CheY-like chemotaxis protein